MCAVMVGVALVTSTAGAARPTRTARAEFPLKTTLTSVSCPSASDCTAVGFHKAAGGISEAIYAVERNGVWNLSRPYMSPGTSEFLGVSCNDAQDCTSAGAEDIQDGFPFEAAAASETSGSWGGLESLGVPSPPDYIEMTGISCAAPGDCTAVGLSGGTGVEWPIYAIEKAGVWGSPVGVTCSGDVCSSYMTSFNAVSCSSATACTAVGGDDVNQAIYATESDGTWGPATALTSPPLAGFDGISCTSATDCTAVGASGSPPQPMYATERNGVWGALVTIPAPGGRGSFYAVSCISATGCTAVGSDGQPIYATETNGEWGGVIQVPSPISGGLFSGVSCTTSTDCTAVGSDALGYALYPTETAGVWPTVPAAPRIRRLIPGMRSIEVVWSAPSSGTKVSTYVVSARQGTHYYGCETTLVSCTLRGLTNGKQYTVWVNARDPAGSSANSAERSTTPHT